MSNSTGAAGPTPGDEEAQAPTATDETAVENHEPAELDLDLVFDALKNARRRRLLRYLNEHDSPVALGDLAEHLAAIENDTTPAMLDSKQRKRVYVALYQSHLPKLNSMGLVEFNKSRGLIERSPAASQVYQYLYDDDDTDTNSWKRVYAESIGVSALVLAVAGLTGQIGGTVAIALFTSLVFGLACLAAYHTYGPE
jgi:DNA-binding transcriptional ArsR family regulator